MDNERQAQYAWIALRCQAGEPGAFEDLIAVMERPLLYYATSLIGNSDTALDVLQEVWIRVFKSIRNLKDPNALRAWLYSIAHGVAIDRIRSNTARGRAEQIQLDGFQESEEPSFANEDADAIHEALKKLNPVHREALTLHFLEDLSIAEIATITGSSEGTVKSRLHYAKRAMKQILQGANHGTAR